MTAQGEGGSRTSVNRNKRCFRKLDVQHSTEQHFKIAENEKPQFYGAHGMLRKQLDYSYHCHYHKERQFVHDSIVEDYLETAEEKETEENSDHSTNWLIFTIGVQGAGKQHAFRELVESDVIPIRSYVRVDQDEICRCLPEYEWYLEQAPEVVEAMTKKESGYIAETLVLAALRAGKIVVWDCQIVDVDWYISRIKELRSLHPCLKIALMYITATKEEVNERCKAETELTGRTISPSCIGNCLSCLPNRVEKLKAEIDFDFSCQIQNDDNLLSIVGDQNFEVFSRDTVPTANERKSCRLSLIETEPFMEDAPEPVANRTSFRVSQDSTDLGDHPSMTKRSHRRRFSRFISSEENHKSDDMNFYGRFAHIRRTLDYNYHSNYTSERQRFQDAIILEFLKAAVIHDKDGEVCTTPTEPWLCFTAGPMGSGKSHTMRRLVESGRFPLLAFVIVDPDEIRRQLPEYHLYVSTQPEIAGEMTRKEAGFIAEILTLAGLETGKNVLVDGTLRDAEWYQEYFSRLRNDFPAVRLAIIQISAPPEAIFERAEKRARMTGRVVPRTLLEKTIKQVPESVKKLAPLVDYHVELFNPAGDEEISIVTEGETWDGFQSHWIQTCAWVPRKLSQNNLRRKDTSSSSRAESSVSSKVST